MRRGTTIAAAATLVVAGLATAQTIDRPHETGTTPPVKPPPRAVIPVSAPAIHTLAQPAGMTSVQVNVNGNGMNIVGDAANEPSIGVNPLTGHIVIGWRQFDTINSDFRESGWSYSHDGGVTWTFPGVLDPGVFRSDPVLETDRFGNFYYYSLFTDLGNTWRCDMYVSADGGISWTDAIFAYGGDKAWFTIDKTGGIGDGNIYVAWNTAGNEYFPATYTRSTDGGLNYLFPIEIPERPKFGSVAVGPDGAMYVIGVSSSTFYVLRSDNAQNPAQTPVFPTVTAVNLGGTQQLGAGPNPAGLLGQAWVRVDASGGPNHGNVYALCSTNPPGGDPLDVMFARSTNGGESFGAPVRLNDDPVGTNAWQWFGTMGVAPNGRIDVVWNDTRNSPRVEESELYYTFSADGGLTWAENMAVSPPFNHFLGYPQNNKLGDYYDIVSDNGGAHVAYAATFNGEQDVYYIHVRPPLPGIPGDVDGDGDVDFEDLLALLAAWGPCAGCPEDVDGDGSVTFEDLLMLLANWT